ncbi:hypothetical protein llap_9502 [Limosa lapponica baueri]|uniref:Uncharacterized protein n=1 Tax=Limosa lapponica baueri TaxID=1758121 RepID=A0A2I0U297_LIMLA|nr:hypothetical protein llap_9502 [Limosa lapponica baueri]
MSSKVKDGTLCSPNKYDVCIDGICEQVGCDHGLGSKAVLDACGVCKGDNSTCKFFKGQYLIQHKANDYYAVVTVPAGARSIQLHEMQISTSYLAVRNLGKKYYLTGDWTIDWPGKFSFAGTVFDYQRSFNHPESLYAAGPTNETLVFECSKTCGRGVKKRDVYCKSTGSPKVKILPESMCSTDHKPDSQQTCVLGRCPKNDRLQWVISSWSECSASCGPGVQKRELKCGEKSIHGKLITFPQRRCRNIKKPNIDLEEACNKGACPSPALYNMVSGWYSSPWQQCTVTCGGGVQTRSVQCLRQGRPASGCLPHQKPAVLRACNTNFCPVPVKRGKIQLYVLQQGWLLRTRDPAKITFSTYTH